MGCIFTKKEQVLLSQSSVSDDDIYIDIFKSNINYFYTNPIHSDEPIKENVVI